MSALRQCIRGPFLCVLLSLGPQVSAMAAAPPDERDRRVLEAVLLHLLADPEFDRTRVPAADGAVVVLHTRTPTKTGLLSSRQMHSDMGSHPLPGDVEEDLLRRNTPSERKPGSYEAVTASFTNLKFSARIVVADLDEKLGRHWFAGFREAYPKARGFVHAFLPGYSKDGTRAVVRAWVGPSPHGASVTALLEKHGDAWVVKWHHIARYL